MLAIDWDLESPGLHRYFHPFLADKELRTSTGMIDLVPRLRRGGRSTADEATARTGSAAPPTCRGYAVSLRLGPRSHGRRLRGRLQGSLTSPPADRTRRTREAVSTFDWASFFERLGGGTFLDALRRQHAGHYDYVLIDSRTGVSDSAGICTVRCPTSWSTASR